MYMSIQIHYCIQYSQLARVVALNTSLLCYSLLVRALWWWVCLPHDEAMAVRVREISRWPVRLPRWVAREAYRDNRLEEALAMNNTYKVMCQVVNYSKEVTHYWTLPFPLLQYTLTSKRFNGKEFPSQKKKNTHVHHTMHATVDGIIVSKSKLEL